jgi:hypothetical protein
LINGHAAFELGDDSHTKLGELARGEFDVDVKDVRGPTELRPTTLSF